jgi:hypothetical protein
MADVPLMNNPMTTAEDLIVGGTSGAPARLAAGSEGDVLQVVSGAVAWDTAPAGPGGGGGTAAVLSPSNDTYIDSQNATTNYDTATDIWVGNLWATASFTRYSLLSFDITALASATVASAVLWLYRTDSNIAYATSVGNIRAMQARRILRAYVPAEVTWNIYSTGNNWTTAGGQGLGTDIDTPKATGTAGVGQAADIDSWYTIDIASLVADAIAASATTLRVMVGASQNGNGSNVMNFASVNNATAGKRPKLRIFYS